MDTFSIDIRELFARVGESALLDAFEAAHQRLVARRVEFVEFGDPQSLTLKRQAAANCKLLQQTSLHRAERLLVSSTTMLLENNVYGLALLVRGHFEAIAVLGYFCVRIESLSTGTIDFETFAQNVAYALTGARHEQFSEAKDALNILTCIERTDKYLDKKFGKRLGVVMDCYAWLSEFAHPNFLSHFSAYRLDKTRGGMVLRHGGDLLPEDFQLMHYLHISSDLFELLFDAFAQALVENDLEL